MYDFDDDDFGLTLTPRVEVRVFHRPVVKPKRERERLYKSITRREAARGRSRSGLV